MYKNIGYLGFECFECTLIIHIIRTKMYSLTFWYSRRESSFLVAFVLWMYWFFIWFIVCSSVTFLQASLDMFLRLFLCRSDSLHNSHARTCTLQRSLSLPSVKQWTIFLINIFKKVHLLWVWINYGHCI